MNNRILRFIPCEIFIASASEQEDAKKIIEHARIFDHFPYAKEVLIQIEQRVPVGLGLSAAHTEWNETYFPNISTPDNLPRQRPETKTPTELLRISVSIIDKHTPRMDSHFGFKGYFLSLLISLRDKMIWDARGEQAK